MTRYEEQEKIQRNFLKKKKSIKTPPGNVHKQKLKTSTFRISKHKNIFIILNHCKITDSQV